MCGAAGLTPLPASSSISATSSGIIHLQLHLHIQLHLQQFQGVDNADDRNDAAADGGDDDHEDEDEDDVERKPKPSSILTLINSSIREKNNTK